MKIIRPSHITQNGDNLSDLFDKEISDQLSAAQREEQAVQRWQQLQVAPVGVSDWQAARQVWRGYGEGK